MYKVPKSIVRIENSLLNIYRTDSMNRFKVNGFRIKTKQFQNILKLFTKLIFLVAQSAGAIEYTNCTSAEG